MDTITVYKDDAGEFRWRRKSPNGRIVAESGEGYTERNDAVEAAERVAHGDVADVAVDPGE